jgi:hypothetical protein
MAQHTYAARLRYLDAHDVDAAVADFDGMEVRGIDNEKLGDIEGFIVDSTENRIYYAVIDAGGWFTSDRFLLPIGHLRLAADRKSVTVDVPKAALRQYPKYDADKFRDFSDQDLLNFERTTVVACCPDDVGEATAGSGYFDARRHYRQPDWWTARAYRAERLRPLSAPTAGVAASTDRAAHRAERAVVREDMVAHEGDDVSPHYGGRAQPGDVLGIETGGERTSVGDTAEHENDQRRTAERTAPREEPRKRDR